MQITLQPPKSSRRHAPAATLQVTLGSLYFVGFGREVHAQWPSGFPFLDFDKRTHGEQGTEWWAFGAHVVVSKV